MKINEIRFSDNEIKRISEELTKRLVNDNSKQINEYIDKLRNIIDIGSKLSNELDNDNKKLSSERLNEIKDVISDNLALINTIDTYIISEKSNEEDFREVSILVHEASNIFRELQHKQLDYLINSNMNKLDYKVKKIEENLSSITFTIISIVLSISVLTALITSIDKINNIYALLFFGTTCIWLLISVLTVSTLILRNNQENKWCLIVILAIFTLIWGGSGYYITTNNLIDVNNNNPQEITKEENKVIKNIKEEMNNSKTEN